MNLTIPVHQLLGLESISNVCQIKIIDRLRTCNETNPKALEHSMK